MAFLDTWPVWLLALAVFSMRIVDVSVGTVRTIAVVNGWIRLSLSLGFVEILVWLLAAAQVITRVREEPVLILAYAGGFASGNAIGIAIERAMALGTCAVEMISLTQGELIAERLRAMGFVVTTFRGEGRDGNRTLLYLTCARRNLRRALDAATELEPKLFYVVQPVSRASALLPLPQPTGWRSVLNKR